MDGEFLFGAVYVIEQDYTEQEIRRDLKHMKDCGFNLITLWPVANAWLAKTSHDWAFEQTRFVLDLCKELQMKAILQLFGQNQSLVFMPDSALTADMEYEDQYGAWINSNCMWANLNHPVVRDYMERYFEAAINALKDHPAVYGWDVFNEAHFRSDDSWTVEKYQLWLKKKYGTIQNLNNQWYRRYESFTQIRPEKRRAPYSIWSSLLPSIEYEKFRSVNVTEICQFLYDTARKYDNVHPVIIDGTSSGILYDEIIMRNNDEQETAFIPDVYGATFYPKSWGRDYKKTPWTLSMYYSLPAGAARRAEKPYFVNELQTHTQSVLTPGSEVSCEELTAWTMMCIFTGASGMQLWRWRPFLHGYQATGRGLTQMDGTPNMRANAIKQLVQMIRENKELFKNFSVANPVVQIAYNYDVRLYFDALLKFGTAGKSFWAQNLEGWYKLFWNAGMLPEFTDLSRLSEREENIPIMVLPGAVRLSRKEAEALCSYVQKGGILIADGRMGAIDETACVPSEGIPGTILSSLFGIRELDVEPEGFLLFGDDKIPTGFQSQKLEITDSSAQTLAFMEDGTPAVVLHNYGKGKTIYCNNFQGLVLLQKLWSPFQKLVDEITKNLNCLHAVKEETVHLSYIESDKQRAVLMVNFSEKPQPVQLYGFETDEMLWELNQKKAIPVHNGTVELALPPTSTKIFTYNKYIEKM